MTSRDSESQGGDRRSISVCIPTLARPSLLDTCLASLEPQWAHVDQVVVAVHGSAELPASPLFDSSKVTVVRYDGPNVGGVRNAAAAAATSDYLLFLDDDDSLAPEALHTLRDLVSDGRCAFGSGGAEVTDTDGTCSVMTPGVPGGLYGGISALILAGSFVIDRQLFARIGGYDEEMRHGENHELGIRVAAAIEQDGLQYRWTDEVVVRYAPSGSPRDEDRIAATTYVLDKHRSAFRRARRDRGRFHAVLGVLHWRHGRRWLARRHFLRALASDPLRPEHWGRLGVAASRRLADRRWCVMSDPDPGRIRVLWVTKGLGPGGAERLLLSFARVADVSRFRFATAYALPEKSHLVGPLHDIGVESACIGSAHGGGLTWLVHLRRTVQQGRFDVVHFHSPLMAGLGRAAIATLRRRPAFVTTAHNIWPSFHPMTRMVDRTTARLDVHLFSVSEAVHQSLPPAMKRRSEVLVHGVDVDAIAARRADRTDIRAEIGVSNQRVVVTIANLRVDKDHLNLFDAAERVLATHDDVVFLAIGQGQLEEELRSDLARRGMGDRFRMLGHQEDPIQYLVAADVFTLASRNEGLPISLLEALAAGLPAAVTAVGGVPDVITDGVEGRLVPPRDPDALAEAIIELLEPEANARASAAALERAKDFDIRRAVERQQDVYEQLARERR